MPFVCQALLLISCDVISSNLGDFLYLLGIRVIFGISLAGCHRSVKSIICFILSFYYFTDEETEAHKMWNGTSYVSLMVWAKDSHTRFKLPPYLDSVPESRRSRGPLPCHPLYQCQLTSCELTSYGPGWTTEMGSSSWHLNPQDCFNSWLCGPKRLTMWTQESLLWQSLPG